MTFYHFFGTGSFAGRDVQKCTYLLPEILFVLKGFVIGFIIVALVEQGGKKAIMDVDQSNISFISAKII